MAIFSKTGLEGGFLIAHVVVAMMWMGLLWFFNFVQTPAYAELDGAARHNAFDKLTWRALWWFRWGPAAATGPTPADRPHCPVRMARRRGRPSHR